MVDRIESDSDPQDEEAAGGVGGGERERDVLRLSGSFCRDSSQQLFTQGDDSENNETGETELPEIGKRMRGSTGNE